MAFTIKELEMLSGIKAHTIRIWEQRYHFLKPDRTPTNIRVYTNEELKTLLAVALLNKNGYRISRIDEMLPSQRQTALLAFQQPEAHHQMLIHELIGSMVDLRHLDFAGLLDGFILKNGLSEALTALIFPFLERVGILWQTGSINPAQEQIVSHIIREKIIRAIDALPYSDRPAPEFLLFLPEDEFHELGLLCVYYQLKKRNIPVLYLGASLPLADLFYVANLKRPLFLYMHLSSFPPSQSLEKYLHLLASHCSDSKILFSGNVERTFGKPLPENVAYLPTFDAVTDFVNDLSWTLAF